MTHFALALTLVLLAITGYLAWEGQLAAKGARLELDFVKNQQRAQEMARPTGDTRVALPQQAPASASATISPPSVPVTTMAAPAPAPVATARPGTPAFPEMAGADALPGGGLTVPKSIVTAEAAGITTNTLSPFQKQVMASRPVAKVKSVLKEQGLIVLDSGSKQQITKGMKLDIRRNSAVLGRATVSDTVEESEALADLDTSSISTGVTIEVGDELILPVSR